MIRHAEGALAGRRPRARMGPERTLDLLRRPVKIRNRPRHHGLLPIRMREQIGANVRRRLQGPLEAGRPHAPQERRGGRKCRLHRAVTPREAPVLRSLTLVYAGQDEQEIPRHALHGKPHKALGDELGDDRLLFAGMLLEALADGVFR